MRNIIFLLSLCGICSCITASDNKEDIKENLLSQSKILACEQKYDTLLLKYANEFAPSKIELNRSLSPDLSAFILSVDVSCLQKQTIFRYFISMVLGKLALYHLKCCNQYYDLYQMREGAAAIIINEFSKLAGYESQNLEMLNSGLIKDFIEKDMILSTNPAIVKVINAIISEENRIKKGVF